MGKWSEHFTNRDKTAQRELLEEKLEKQTERIRELTEQLALAEEARRQAEAKLCDASHYAPGVRELDSNSIQCLFGDQAKCHAENSMLILKEIRSFYLRLGEIPVEICLPSGIHFEQLSQVPNIIQPQPYPALIKLLETCGEKLDETGVFLPCAMEGIKDDTGRVVACRLTLAPPGAGHFAYIYNGRIRMVELSEAEYLRRVKERLERSLNQEEKDSASRLFHEVMELICESWSKKHSGVIIPDQTSNGQTENY